MKTTYTIEDLRSAFYDGVTVGIAVQSGEFGEEDFMGGPAAVKAHQFIEKESGFPSWEDLWAYCGGGIMLDGPPTQSGPSKHGFGYEFVLNPQKGFPDNEFAN